MCISKPGWGKTSVYERCGLGACEREDESNAVDVENPVEVVLTHSGNGE